MGFLDKIKEKRAAGAEHMEGSHAHAPGTVQDPVCKMWVDPKTSKFSSAHGGHTSYFCSAGCKASFDKDPHKYLGHHMH